MYGVLYIIRIADAYVWRCPLVVVRPLQPVRQPLESGKLKVAATTVIPPAVNRTRFGKKPLRREIRRYWGTSR